MKHVRSRWYIVLAGALVAGLTMVGCKQDALVSSAGLGLSYSQVNLVSNLDTFHPTPVHIDTNLLNPWGLAMDPAGIFEIGANHSGTGDFYDDMGNVVLPAIQIPSATEPPGAPAGAVFNSSSEFVIAATGERAKLIFSTEDGLICAWSSGPDAQVVVAPLDTGSVYKGLAMAMHGRKAYLYATNFGDHRIDVFNGEFELVTSFPFVDTTLPPEYSPFGIANVDGKLWVTYAIPKPPDFHDDLAGPGHGVIDIFNPNGSFVRRFHTFDVLNSPWGVTKAPEGMGDLRRFFLIGNFGDGKINAFDNSGKYVGSVMTAEGDPIVIEGLWALSAMPGRGQGRVYFTAGPNEESDGLFGYLSAESSILVRD